MMGEGFQFIDLIFYAMIAVFLILRLRSVLGRRTGRDEWNKSNSFGKEKQVENKYPHGEANNVLPAGSRTSASNLLEAALIQMRIADPYFNTDSFLHGAQLAFKVIVTAFVKGDRHALQSLLSDSVLSDFNRAIEARAKTEESVETQLLGTPSAEIVSAKIEAKMAFVTVHFISEQISVIRDRDGNIIDGDPNQIIKVEDLWIFARDIQSLSPNWFLVETRSGNNN